jgi:PAS domain S-box-containing protein
MPQDHDHKGGHSEPEIDGSVFRLRTARDAALQAAREAVRDTTRLTRLLTVLNEPTPLNQLLDRALATLSELFLADIVVLLDPAGTGNFAPLAAIGLPEDIIRQPMSDTMPGYAAATMASETPVLITKAGADPKVDAQLRELGAETVVWLPVIDTQSVRGALVLARCRPMPFANADADLLAAMAYRIGLTLEQAQRSAQLEQLVRVGRLISSQLEVESVAAEAVRRFPEVVLADAAVLVLIGADGQPSLAHQAGVSSEEEPLWCLLTERLLTEARLAAGQPYRIEDLHTVADRFAVNGLSRSRARSLLVIPIRRENQVQGLLFAVRFSAMTFSPDTLQVAALYADQTSAALENARLYRAVRESEQRFATAFQWSPLAIALTTLPEGRFLDVNETFLHDIGYTRSEAIGQTYGGLRLLADPDDETAIRAELAGHGHVYARECRFRRKSADIVSFLVSASTVDIDGRPCALFSTVDMTEAKQIQAEKLLMEQQKQRIWRAESLSRMAGGIAHHFNNLLGVVTGNLELAQGNLSQGADLRPHLSDAMKASHRAIEISKLMLAYLGQTTVAKTPLDLAEAVREALPLSLLSIPQNVQLKPELPSRGPMIRAAGVHIKQIVTNVIVNSAEAIGDREGQIIVATGLASAREIRASRYFPLDWKPQAATYAFVSVSDTGCGLDTANVEKIFEPFFSTKFTGRGLGLSVVLGLIRSNAGAISVESNPDHRTIFRMYFPELTQAEAGRRVKEAPLSAKPDHKGLVLLADDEPMVRHMAAAQLKRLGFTVVSAVDGLDAVEKFRTEKNDIRLAILDLSMPRLDGWQTLAALRDVRRDLPVILVSGYDEAQVRRDDSPERPQAFLQKPYGARELEAVVDGALKAGGLDESP